MQSTKSEAKKQQLKADLSRIEQQIRTEDAERRKRSLEKASKVCFHSSLLNFAASVLASIRSRQLFFLGFPLISGNERCWRMCMTGLQIVLDLAAQCQKTTVVPDDDYQSVLNVLIAKHFM